MDEVPEVVAQDPGAVRETDIVFDCPHCGKSLAIDYRGAGLTIPCTDCGKSVEVPIPEGMQITDFDSTEEEQEIRIMNLRRSLASAEARIQELESEMGELRLRRDVLEKVRSDSMYRLGVISEKISLIEKAIHDIATGLKSISEIVAKPHDTI